MESQCNEYSSAISRPTTNEKFCYEDDDDDDEQENGSLLQVANYDDELLFRKIHSLKYEASLLKKGICEMTQENTINKLRKAELLHKKWQNGVFQPIQSNIKCNLQAGRSEYIQTWRDNLYEQYLCHTNKGHIFLDDDDPTQYQAISICPPKSLILQVHTGRLKDPLKLEQRRRLSEKAHMHQLETGCYPTAHQLELMKKSRVN